MQSPDSPCQIFVQSLCAGFALLSFPESALSLGRLLCSSALSLQTERLLTIPDAVFTLPASQVHSSASAPSTVGRVDIHLTRCMRHSAISMAHPLRCDGLPTTSAAWLRQEVRMASAASRSQHVVPGSCDRSSGRAKPHVTDASRYISNGGVGITAPAGVHRVARVRL